MRDLDDNIMDLYISILKIHVISNNCVGYEFNVCDSKFYYYENYLTSAGYIREQVIEQC